MESKIEKLERVKPEKLMGMMGKVAPQWVAKELNKIIDYLNQSQKEPEDIVGDRIRRDMLDDAFKLRYVNKPEKQVELRRGIVRIFAEEDVALLLTDNLLEQLVGFISQLLSEEYQRGVKEGTEGKFYEKIEVVSQIPEEVVEQLLSERTFSKEELRLLNAYLSLALPEYNNFDKETKMHEDMDKLHKILEKISKLLKEKE